MTGVKYEFKLYISVELEMIKYLPFWSGPSFYSNTLKYTQIHSNKHKINSNIHIMY